MALSTTVHEAKQKAGQRGAILRLLLASLLLTLPALDTVRAQDFGQWTWDAIVGAKGRNLDNQVGGRDTGTSRQQDLRLGIGMDGYILHPAFAHFRLGGDFSLSDSNNDVSDRDNIGLEAALDLLPTSAIPSNYFFRRRTYGYQDLFLSGPYAIRGVPDGSTSYGGSVRTRRGALAGMSLSYQRHEIEFLDPGADMDRSDDIRLNWTRAFGPITHSLLVSSRAQEFGSVDLDYDDLTVNLSERGFISENWYWDMTGTAFRRDLIVDSLPETTSGQYRLRNHFRRDIRKNEWLEFTHRYAHIEPDETSSDDSNVLNASWNRPLGEAWHLAPFVEYSRSSSDDLDLEAPRAGVSLTWKDRGEQFDAGLGTRVSYGQVHREMDDQRSDENQSAYSLSGNVGHGVALGGLRKLLEFEIARNELRLERELFLELPTIGVPIRGVGCEDTYRVRFSLAHHWDSRQLSAWSEWRVSDIVDELQGEDSRAETLFGTLEFSAHKFQISGNIASTSLTRTRGQDEDIFTLGTWARWRPWRQVALRGLYRRDERNLIATPDIDADRFEAGVEVQIGRFQVSTSYYVTREQFTGNDETIQQGVYWAISRRFAGWLPIRTGRTRMGTIR